MSYRTKVRSTKRNRRNFSFTARKVHKKNLPKITARGGIRL